MSASRHHTSCCTSDVLQAHDAQGQECVGLVLVFCGEQRSLHKCISQYYSLVNTTVWFGSIISLFALQVVPTMYSDVRNKTIHSNQYSVTEHFKRAEIQQGQNMPGVFFFYDLSPIKVTS
jgi:hypothetical protein